MIRKLKKSGFIIAGIVLLTGCSIQNHDTIVYQENLIDQMTKRLEQYKLEANQLKEELELAQQTISNNEKTIDEYKMLIIQQNQEIEDIQNKDLIWLQNKWDEIIIEDWERQVDITESKVLESIAYFLDISKEIEMPPSGFHSDVPPYRYILKSGEKKYSLRVVDRGVVEIDGRYYQANKDVHHLGNAFLPSQKYMEAGNIETKIAQSGIVVGKNQASDYLVFSAFRIQRLASVLCTEGKGLEAAPVLDSQEIQTSFLFYYFGNKISMNIYPNNIQIIDGKKECWYELQDAVHIIDGIITAG